MKRRIFHAEARRARTLAAEIAREAARLRAAADATENVEQLEAIERDLERLVGTAKRIQRLVTSGGAQ